MSFDARILGKWSVARSLALGLAFVLGFSIVRGSSHGEEKPATGEWEVPEGIRTIMLDPAGSTSTCIGISSSPLCALENVLICEQFTRPRLCEVAGHPLPWAGDEREIYRRFSATYIHLSSQTLVDADIPDWARDIGTHIWRPGDVGVRLWWRNCDRPNGERCGFWEYFPKTYVIRRIGNLWHVVDVAYPATPSSDESYGRRLDAPPGEQRVLTYDLARSTSRCIGNPVTPLCAAETWEACHFFYEPDYCATIGSPWSPETVAVGYHFLFTRLYYRVLAFRRLDGRWPYCFNAYGPCGQAGDVVVEIKQKLCNRHGCQGWTTGVGRFITRPVGDRWVFVDWGR
jgi:hypothetical protein